MLECSCFVKKAIIHGGVHNISANTGVILLVDIGSTLADNGFVSFLAQCIIIIIFDVIFHSLKVHLFKHNLITLLDLFVKKS